MCPSVKLISVDADLKPYVSFTPTTNLTFKLPPSLPLTARIYQLTFRVSDESPYGALYSLDTLSVRLYAPQTAIPPSSQPPAMVEAEKPPTAVPKTIKPLVKVSRPLRVEVMHISSQGFLTLRYSDKILNTSLIDEAMILLKVREGVTDKEGIIENKTILRWNVTRVGDRDHEFAIEFAEPGDISNDKVRIYNDS